MFKRRRLSKKRSKRMFKKGVNKVNRLNYVKSMRGGIRL